MSLLIFAVLVILAVSGFAAYFIALKVYKTLVKGANKNSMVLGVITGIASFAIITAAICYLILLNLDFHR